MRYNCFGYSVISIGFWAQEVVCNQVIDVGTAFMKVLYLGRAPRTKETLPDFREKCRVTRHSRVFRGLTGSQRTPGFWAVTSLEHMEVKGCPKMKIFYPNLLITPKLKSVEVEDSE